MTHAYLRHHIIATSPNGQQTFSLPSPYLGLTSARRAPPSRKPCPTQCRIQSRGCWHDFKPLRSVKFSSSGRERAVCVAVERRAASSLKMPSPTWRVPALPMHLDNTTCSVTVTMHRAPAVALCHFRSSATWKRDSESHRKHKELSTTHSPLPTFTHTTVTKQYHNQRPWHLLSMASPWALTWAPLTPALASGKTTG